MRISGPGQGASPLDPAEEHSPSECAIEACHRLLQECNTTGVEVVKATANLAPKGGRGQQQAARKAERDKYLSRVGQLGRLW
jgi:hypothetical protein